jgi:glycosyltransferase involved in cell wall biosynthesis
MRKLAIVTPFGAEPRLDNYAEFVLAQHFTSLGDVVHFYTYKISSDDNYRKDAIYKGVNVHRCRQRYGISPRLFFSILLSRPDIIIYLHPRSSLSMTAYYAGRLVGAKMISEIVGILHDPYIVDDPDDPVDTIHRPVQLLKTWHDYIRSIFKSGFSLINWNNFLYHAPVYKADHIIAINQEEKGFIKQFYDKDSSVIYWSTPPKDHSVGIEPPSLIENKPLEYILFIGQIKRRKGYDTALEAISILKKRDQTKNLIFVCPVSDISEARRLTEELEIVDQVTFLSSISNAEKQWLYLNAKCIIVPSRYEGFGLPIFEAFNTGTPVLVSDLTVFKEFLTDEKNCLMSPVGNSSALADNLEKIYSNVKLTDIIVRGGYKTAEAFAPTVMIDKFESLFSEILN